MEPELADRTSATGDHNDDVQALLRGQFDMAVFTYEKFSGLVLAQPHLLRMTSVLVVDEVQTVVDASRGRELELLLTLIKRRREEGIEPQVVALSAVLGDINGLDSWLEASPPGQPRPGRRRWQVSSSVIQLIRAAHSNPRSRAVAAASVRLRAPSLAIADER